MSNGPSQINLFLSMFSMQLPTLLVCLVACVVILTRWKQSPSGALWALLGFGLVLALCVVMPIVQTFLQNWVFQAEQRTERVWVYSVSSVVWAVLHATAYAFLLVAVFAGRTKPTPPPA
jgi:hypothetical protein